MLFESERLYYRCFSKADVEAGVKLWGNERVMKYIEPPLSEEQVLKSIKAGLEHYKKYKTQYFAVVLKDTDEIIGCCGFSVEDYKNSIYEFVIHLLPEYQSQGYGFEAGTSVIDYMKSKIKQVIAACHIENIQSYNLLLKLGFEYKGEVWFDDTNRYEKYFELNF